ncbi:hypothetical protein AAVH_16101 [Aphelenchoides avenae]|nr:hypothetical protein AAVH_16101 [Aphelenchus avenae]
MENTEFHPYSECGILRVNLKKPTTTFVGGLWWVATGSAEKHEATGRQVLHKGEITVRCSLPLGVQIQPVQAKVTFFGFPKTFEWSMTVEKDGSSASASHGYCGHHPDGYAVAIEVFGQTNEQFEEPDVPENDVVLQVGDQEFPADIKHLSKVSSVFKEMFKLEFPPNEGKTVIIDGVTATDFGAFMDCLMGVNAING